MSKKTDAAAERSPLTPRAVGDFILRNALYIMIILLVVFVAIQKPQFLLSAPLDIVKKSAAYLIMALGVGGIIVLTGTDLSAGRTLGITACISASLLQKSDYAKKMWDGINLGESYAGIILVLIICIAIGALVGLVNGFCVAKFSLHPFIVTLATQLMIYGAVLIYVEQGNNAGAPISGLTDKYSNLAKGTLFKIGKTTIPAYVLYAIIMVVIMWFVWNKTTLGKNMYAVGSNPEAANVSGVSVFWTITLIFVMAGALYGMAGWIEAARIGSNSASTGVNYELDAIAACVIGGVSFTGGVGKISGVVAGVVLLQVIAVALQWLSVSAAFVYVIKGLIILVAVAIDMRKYLAKK